MSGSNISQVAAGSSGTSQASKAYDPQQDIRNKRELRKEIRQLTARTHDFRANGTPYDSENLLEMLRSGEELRAKVTAPREAMLDSHFLGGVADLGVQLTRSMKTKGVGLDIDEYLTRVAKVIGGAVRTSNGAARGTRKKRKSTTNAGEADQEDDEDNDDDVIPDDVELWDWHKLGMIGAKYTRRAPVMDHLVGPLAVEAKERKVAKRPRLEAGGDVQEARPDTINEAEIQRSENETTRLVQNIAHLLESVGGENGVNLFEFAVNPKSFSNTVENFFYISFLVRDGMVSIDDEGDNPPTILRCQPPTHDDYQAGLKKRQIVLELDKQTWRDLIQAYNIKESLIPTRRATTGERVGGWHG